MRPAIQIERMREWFEQLQRDLRPTFDEERNAWDEHGPAAMARAVAAGIVIDTIGGNCPVQAEGEVDGQPFYFRARGAAWSLTIGQQSDWFTPRAWYHDRPFGTWPDAGWMHRHEAIGFICDAVEAWRVERRAA